VLTLDPSDTIPPSTKVLQQALGEARDRIRQLETGNHRLREQITTLCAVITELDHEARADNVIPMSAHRSRPR